MDLSVLTQPKRENSPWLLTKMPQTFVVRVVNQEEVIFVGKVKALAAINKKGPFDVLPGHTNLISVIYKHVILYLPDLTQREIPTEIGVIRFFNNSCDVFLGIELRSFTGDVDSIKKSLVAENSLQ